MEGAPRRITTSYVSKWDADKKLRYWKKYGLSVELIEDYLIFEREVLEYRQRLPESYNTPKVYFNSVEQIEARIEWLESELEIRKTTLYKVLYEE